MKAEQHIQNGHFLRAAEYYNEAAILALQINDKDTFQNFMSKVEEYQKTEEETKIKVEKERQLRIMEQSIPKILAEAESAKLSRNFEKTIELYLKVANINQNLGNMENFMKYITIAKDFRTKLENSKKK